MADQLEPSEPPTLTPKRVVWILSIVVLLWLLAPVFIFFMFASMEQRGQFGDLYGAINALFSGLAFAGVVIAILMQREELRIQRQELRLQRQELKLQREEVAANRVELARAATAQEESREALRRTIYAQAFKTAMDILQADSVREARAFVLTQLRYKPFASWHGDDRRMGERVCNTYDMVGIMIKHDMLPVEYIADSWGDSLRQAWRILEPLVEKYRIDRNAPEYWDNFQELAAVAERSRKQPTTTPGS